MARVAALRSLRLEDAEARLLCADLCSQILREREALIGALAELLEAHKLGSNRRMIEVPWQSSHIGALPN